MKYLGIDWGLKKIGLAVSDGVLATPFRVLSISSLKEGLLQIEKVASQENIDHLVIGQPEGGIGKKVAKAASLLSEQGFIVHIADETLSTQNAKKLAIQMGYPQKQRRDDNALAAVLILQNFLDENS